MFNHQVLVLVLLLLYIVTPIAGAQTSTQGQGQAQRTQGEVIGSIPPLTSCGPGKIMAKT
jgi:hypothetical protein